MTKIKIVVAFVAVLFLLSLPRPLAAQMNAEPNFTSSSINLQHNLKSKQIANRKLEQDITQASADNIGHALAVFAIFACLALVRKH